MTAVLMPWMMLKVIFFTLPKSLVLMPRVVARSVSSQSTTASGTAVLPSGVGRLRPPGPAAERDEAIAAIAAHDPAFTSSYLARRAASVHDVVSRSLVEGDAAAARLVMADGLWGIHRMLVSVRSDHGVRRESAVQIIGAEVVEAYSSTLVDEVRVRLACAGVCCDLHTGTGLVLRGSRTAGSPRSSAVLWQHDKKTRKAMEQKETGVINGVLQRVVNEGTGKAAAIDRPVAGKTGTTNESKDVWFVGYTPQLATAVWVGNVDAPKPLTDAKGRALFGGGPPARIFSSTMKAALQGVAGTPLQVNKPEDLGLKLPGAASASATCPPFLSPVTT